MYAGGVLVDNADKSIAEVYGMPFVRAIKIPDSGPSAEIAMSGDTKLATYISSVGPNYYVDSLKKAGILTDSYDAISGMRAGHMDLVRDALRKIKGRKCVLLDWDRTITLFEGVYFDRYVWKYMRMQQAGLTVDMAAYREDQLRYLCGPERLSLLRAFVSSLLAEGVDVFILTNNKICGKLQFYRMIKAFHAGIPASRILCARPYDGDKGVTLFASGRFTSGRFASGRFTRKNRRKT